MIIFLYGQNSYLKVKKLNSIIEAFKEKNKEAAIPRFDFEIPKDEEDFFSFASAVSMFEIKKGAILENIFDSSKKKELKKLLQDYVDDKETFFVIISEVKPPASFAFLTKKPVVNQEFPQIKDQEDIESFIRDEALQRGLELEDPKIHAISSLWGKDLWGISTELDSLALSPERMVEDASASDYFKLLSGFKFAKSEKERVVALEIMMTDRRDDSAKIFNGLAFGSNKKEFIKRLAEYDVMVKSGRLEYEEALVDLALSS